MQWFIENLGFSKQDTLLLLLCPLFALLGGMVHMYTLAHAYSKMPRSARFRSREEAYPLMMFSALWASGRLLLAAIAGLILSLYMVGALTNYPATIARILGASILVGYVALRLWATQEAVFINVLERRVRKTLEDHGLIKEKRDTAPTPREGT